MALVLRKAGAGLTKNVSLLRSIKGRSFASATTNKKNTTPLSTAGHIRKYKNKIYRGSIMIIKSVRRLAPVKECGLRTKNAPVHVSLSCPNFVRQTSLQQSSQIFSELIITPTCLPKECAPRYTKLQSRSYSKSCNASNPCPHPCDPCGCPSGCNCLPPPCNTPAKCVQYMTGYYYYPYGTWFCGPYHVTGTCTPVKSPGPCCPTPCPCPNPCPPPCPKCCAVLGVVPAGNPNSQMYPINVPITPIPVTSDHLTQPSPNLNMRQPKSNLPNQPSNAFSSNPPTSGQSCNQTQGNLNKYYPNKPTDPKSKPSSQSFPPVLSSMMYFPINSHANMDSNNMERCHKYLSRKPETRAKYSTNAMEERETNSPTEERRRMFSQGPQLEKPRTIMTKAERDHPDIKPESFDYTSIPKYKRPSPKPYSDLFEINMKTNHRP